MKTFRTRFLASAAVLFFIGMTPYYAVSQTTITVPDDYSTIQLAIDYANPGDTVYVRSGTYYEHVIINKSLNLLGEDKETTIIDGSASGKVVFVTASNVIVSGFTIRNSGNSTGFPQDAGIVIYSASNTIISGCIVAFNKLNGLYGYGASYTTIQNCDISYNEPDSIIDGAIRGAIHLRSSSNSIIAGNTIYENKGMGITIRDFGSNVTVTENHLYSNTSTGIHMGWGSGCLVSENIAHNNGGGIHLDSTFHCLVESNNVFLGGAGIYVGYVGRYNTIRGNISRYNTWGILMGGNGVLGNKIYHNDLIENTRQAYDKEGDNIWDNGYPSGGNYWSDYTGDDFNIDGIGDTPYLFENTQDNYPLIWPLWSPLEVLIDIKPGSYPNSINLGSKGKIPIAILSAPDFDATQIDIASIKVDSASVVLKRNGTWQAGLEDINADGFLDLVIHVETSDLGLSESTTLLSLTGITFNGVKIYGEDSVLIAWPKNP